MVTDRRQSASGLKIGDIERAIPGKFEAPAASGFYLIGLFFVTAFALALPFIYLGIIAGVALLGFFIAVQGLGWMAGMRPAFFFVCVILYLAAIFACGVVIYYLVRQLFVKKQSYYFGDMLELDPIKEPLLYALARNVADRIKAPAPDRIYLSMDANAAAVRTYKYMFFADKRFLILGMPYIEGLSARSLAGIIAHELGHHSQEAGATLGYALDSVVSWFGRAAYPRESWGDKIEKITGSDKDSASGFQVYARFLSTAGLLATILTARVIFKIGLLISRFFLRRREFDADAFNVAIQGSASFCESERKCNAMSLVQSYLFENLPTFERSGQLPENIPSAVAAMTEDMDEAAKKGVEKYLKAMKSTMDATHPTPNERAAAALKRNSMGIFALDAPASALLTDSYAAGRELTLNFYKHIPAIKLETQKLATTDEFIGKKKKITQELDNLDAFLGSTINFKNLFFPPPLAIVPPDNPKDILEGWRNARRKMLELQKDAEAFTAIYDEIAKNRRNALVAYRLIKLGIPIKDPRKYGLSEASESAAVATLNKCAARKNKTDELLAPYFKVAGTRIWCVLTLLGLPAAQQNLPKGREFHAGSRKLMETILAFKSAYDLLLQLDAEGDELLILNNITDSANALTIKDARIERLAAIRSLLTALKSNLSGVEYPFAKDASEGNIWDWATRANRAFANDETAMLNAASDIMTNLPRLYSRVLGRLCVIVAQAESLFQNARN